jgi:hypothetical protein
MVFAMMSIGLLGFLVWAQMMGLYQCELMVKNFAIFWNVLIILSHWLFQTNGKILKFKQSVGKINFSSETTRKMSYFKNYIDFLHIKKLDENFLCWFIGFTEGDGSFSTDGKRNFFQIVQKDPKILYYIKEHLGFGTVVLRKDGYFLYRVVDQVNIDRLIRIFAGNLQLKKTQLRFKEWLITYSNYTKLPLKLDLSLVVQNDLIHLNSAWISGFIDAEGCFNVGLNLTNRLLFRFIIDQKNESEILQKILYTFGVGHLSLENRLSLKTMQRLVVTSKFTILFNYLEKYNLRSNKFISLERFKHIYNYKLLPKKEYDLILNNPKDFLKLKRLIQSVNSFEYNLKI